VISAAAAKKRLASIGLRCVLEKDATSGFEFLVEDGAGETVAWGWSAGTRTEALNEAVTHPAIQLRLSKAVAP
jgi:hypothetical protein